MKNGIESNEIVMSKKSNEIEVDPQKAQAVQMTTKTNKKWTR